MLDHNYVRVSEVSNFRRNHIWTHNLQQHQSLFKDLKRGIKIWHIFLWSGAIFVHMSRFVSAGDTLGRERPMTSMSSYFTGRSECAVI